jgi:hypothetical protein
MAKRRKRKARGFGLEIGEHAEKAMAYYNDAEHAAREALRKIREPARAGKPHNCEDAFDLIAKARQMHGRAQGHRDGASDTSNHEIAARAGNSIGTIDTAERAFYSGCVVRRKGA